MNGADPDIASLTGHLRVTGLRYRSFARPPRQAVPAPASEAPPVPELMQVRETAPPPLPAPVTPFPAAAPPVAAFPLLSEALAAARAAATPAVPPAARPFAGLAAAIAARRATGG